MSNEKSTKKQAEKKAVEKSFFFPTYGRSVTATSKAEALKRLEAQASA